MRLERFARLRLEKRHNYVRKVAEVCKKLLIDPATNAVAFDGIVVAGAAEIKHQLMRVSRALSYY